MTCRIRLPKMDFIDSSSYMSAPVGGTVARGSAQPLLIDVFSNEAFCPPLAHLLVSSQLLDL
jgi:hypothetical protein